MQELELLCKSIARIHDAALDALGDETLSPQTRREVGRIAEEALELCQMLNAYVAKGHATKNQGLIGRVWAFLENAVSFLSQV